MIMMKQILLSHQIALTVLIMFGQINQPMKIKKLFKSEYDRIVN